MKPDVIMDVSEGMYLVEINMLLSGLRVKRMLFIRQLGLLQLVEGQNRTKDTPNLPQQKYLPADFNSVSTCLWICSLLACAADLNCPVA